MTVTPTYHESKEFSRLARYAYANGRNDIGHKFSVAAARQFFSVAEFDALKTIYRNWLVFDMLPSEDQDADCHVIWLHSTMSHMTPAERVRLIEQI